MAEHVTAGTGCAVIAHPLVVCAELFADMPEVSEFPYRTATVVQTGKAVLLCAVLGAGEPPDRRRCQPMYGVRWQGVRRGGALDGLGGPHGGCSGWIRRVLLRQ